MSTTPQKYLVTVSGVRPTTGMVGPVTVTFECQDQAHVDRLFRAANAFDALLAVAKAASKDWYTEAQRIYDETGYLPSEMRHAMGTESLAAKIKALDAAHPDWRNW